MKKQFILFGLLLFGLLLIPRDYVNPDIVADAYETCIQESVLVNDVVQPVYVLQNVHQDVFFDELREPLPVTGNEYFMLTSGYNALNIMPEGKIFLNQHELKGLTTMYLENDIQPPVNICYNIEGIMDRFHFRLPRQYI
jgi:hypothetical protein